MMEKWSWGSHEDQTLSGELKAASRLRFMNGNNHGKIRLIVRSKCDGPNRIFFFFNK